MIRELIRKKAEATVGMTMLFVLVMLITKGCLGQDKSLPLNISYLLNAISELDLADNITRISITFPGTASANSIVISRNYEETSFEIEFAGETQPLNDESLQNLLLVLQNYHAGFNIRVSAFAPSLDPELLPDDCTGFSRIDFHANDITDATRSERQIELVLTCEGQEGVALLEIDRDNHGEDTLWLEGSIIRGDNPIALLPANLQDSAREITRRLDNFPGSMGVTDNTSSIMNAAEDFMAFPVDSYIPEN